MLSRQDFIFTIGYDGPTAIVDGQAKRRYGASTTAQLAEAGLFRAAYASAVHSGKAEELDVVVAAYNRAAGTSLTRESPLGRLFGVYLQNVSACKSL